MSAAAHAQSSYGHSARSLRTPRDVEYELLARITGRIQANLPHARGRLSPDLVAALHENQRMWVAFATDLAHADNGFPQELRARLFYLAEFTGKHTAQVLAGEAIANVLAEINTAVMRGLRGHRVRP